MKSINRRDFLFATRSFFCGLIIWGFSPFQNQAKAFSSRNKKNVLVLYATYHGSTAQIAEFIRVKLNNGEITASVKSIEDYIDFSGYSGIIMGAPIHRGKWMEDAVEFVNKHRDKFDNLPFACFYTCMSKAKIPPSEETLDELSSYQTAMRDLFPKLNPSQIGSFAGKLDYDKCNFLTKIVMWSILSKNSLEAGDYRDWQAIESWTGEIKEKLLYKNTTKSI